MIQKPSVPKGVFLVINYSKPQIRKMGRMYGFGCVFATYQYKFWDIIPREYINE